jgi:hypothetical protein
VISAKLELELSGFGNGWTDVSADLMGEESGGYGLPGSSARDVVARTGELKFHLKNHESNTWGLEGAYSPDHANCAAGFAEGIRVRYSQVVGSDTFVVHVGTLDEIIPDPDPLGGGLQVHCTSVDYMDDLARASCSGLEILEDARDDEIFSTLVASLARQPDAIQVVDGPDTFPVALDKVESRMRVLSVLQDVCQSSLSLCYDQAGTLVYEPRNVRAATTTAVDTFTQNLVGLDVSRSRRDRINRVEVTAHPRKIDASPTTVLWSLPSGAGNAVAIPGGTSVVIWTPYTDPVTKQPIGALDVDETPAPTTDYQLTANADGTGADLTASLSVTVEPFANTSKVTYSNGGTTDGHLVVARILGRGIYDYSPSLLQAEDVDSQVNAGLNILSFDAPYQSSIATANEIALYLVNLYKGAATKVNKVVFRVPRTDDALAARVLARGISDRIALAETLTGLSAARHFFINAVEYRSDERHNLEVSWTLAPADSTSYWLLGVSGRSELDNTARLGFGLVLGHIDVAHGDAHGDSAFADVAHADSHGDGAHLDTAHGDGATHGDSAHSDTAHSDSAHSDVAHSDAHSDVAHSDRAHTDSHSDVGHSDVGHADSAHADSAHADIAHADESHTDEGLPPSQQETHSDGAHSDIAHGDVSHGDSHTDVAHSDTHNDLSHLDSHSDTHSDVTHVDVAHADVVHVDTAHSDAAGHADSAHSDVAHSDVAHADVVHVDQPHGDTHTDAEHADVN